MGSNTLFRRFTRSLLRTAALLLAVCTLITGIPFSTSALQTKSSGNGYVDLTADSVTFKAGQTLIREKDFTITTKSISTRENGFIILELTAKNTGTAPIYFRTACSKVEGYDVSASLYQTVRPGNQADIIVALDALPLAAVGISVIRQLDIVFDVVHDDTYKVLYDDCAITIPLGVPIDMDYTAYKKCIYQEDAFALYLLGSVQVERRASPSLIFLLENNLDGPVLARNDGDLTVNNTERNFYIHEYASAYRDAVFSVASSDKFLENYPGTLAHMYFPLQICTGNLNPIIYTELHVQLKTDGTIKDCTVSSAKSTAYDICMGEYGQNKNMFMGMFHNYKLNPDYVSTLKKKYPENQNRFYGSSITPYVSELLTLYLANLEKAGYRFGVVERPDLCSEQSYVVELTENGGSVIQVAFTLNEYDPKSARIITLGCSSDNFQNLDKLNSCLDAMWIAYDTINVHMTKEKHSTMLERSEVSTSPVYGTLLRGENDGLGYVLATGKQECYLSISPDLSLAPFAGMQTGKSESQYPTQDLTVGNTFFFGSYEQDNIVTNGAEKIQWVVAAKEVGKILAVSVQGLDAKPFHTYSQKVSWKDCSLRTWLNKDFYNTAFNRQEQTRICSQQVEVLAGEDKVFLLSREEAEGYFPYASDRTCTASPYAVSQNAYLNAQNKCCWWLLRTAGTGGTGLVMSVNTDGSMDYKGGRVESNRGAVRPAIWIKTDS